MAQRYTSTTALSRMLDNLCPECGESAERHVNSTAFWVPRRCDLLPHGVTERVEQYWLDVTP